MGLGSRRRYSNDAETSFCPREEDKWVVRHVNILGDSFCGIDHLCPKKDDFAEARVFQANPMKAQVEDEDGKRQKNTSGGSVFNTMK